MRALSQTDFSLTAGVPGALALLNELGTVATL